MGYLSPHGHYIPPFGAVYQQGPPSGGLSYGPGPAAGYCTGSPPAAPQPTGGTPSSGSSRGIPYGPPPGPPGGPPYNPPQGPPPGPPAGSPPGPPPGPPGPPGPQAPQVRQVVAIRLHHLLLNLLKVLRRRRRTTTTGRSSSLQDPLDHQVLRALRDHRVQVDLRIFRLIRGPTGGYSSLLLGGMPDPRNGRSEVTPASESTIRTPTTGTILEEFPPSLVNASLISTPSPKLTLQGLRKSCSRHPFSEVRLSYGGSVR